MGDDALTERPIHERADPPTPNLAPEEEPVTTGTLFLTMIILMLIGAIWVIVYRMLLWR
jgi:hypothetical protein